MKAVSKPKPMKSDGTCGAPAGAEDETGRLIPLAAPHVAFAVAVAVLVVVFLVDVVLVLVEGFPNVAVEVYFDIGAPKARWPVTMAAKLQRSR